VAIGFPASPNHAIGFAVSDIYVYLCKMETKRKGRPARLSESQKIKAFHGTHYTSLEAILKKFGSFEAAKQAANQAVKALFEA